MPKDKHEIEGNVLQPVPEILKIDRQIKVEKAHKYVKNGMKKVKDELMRDYLTATSIYLVEMFHASTDEAYKALANGLVARVKQFQKGLIPMRYPHRYTPEYLPNPKP